MGRKSQRRHRPWDPRNEPALEGEEWVEWGGQLIWAVGFTEGGAPYGPTREELAEGFVTDEAASGRGWARAKTLLQQAFARWTGGSAEVDVGRVVVLGEGLSRRAFAAAVDIQPDPMGVSGAYVVLLIRPEIPRSFDERTRFEARLLTHLSSLDLPLRAPRILDILSEGGRPVLIETMVEGVPLDLRAGRQPGVKPWDVVAEVAATVHSVDAGALAGCVGPTGSLPGFATRRDHAFAELSVLEQSSEPLLREIHAWGLEHLPPPQPSVLLHGDLLGENVLLHPREPLGLIDWGKAQLGDPAYDLAVVTRGAKKPFQIAGGLSRLLEAYASRSSAEIAKEHVHLYELCMKTRRYFESLDEPFGDQPPDEIFGNLRNTFRRAMGGS